VDSACRRVTPPSFQRAIDADRTRDDDARSRAVGNLV
jgi:hypothetical protein